MDWRELITTKFLTVTNKYLTETDYALRLVINDVSGILTDAFREYLNHLNLEDRERLKDRLTVNNLRIKDFESLEKYLKGQTLLPQSVELLDMARMLGMDRQKTARLTFLRFVRNEAIHEFTPVQKALVEQFIEITADCLALLDVDVVKVRTLLKEDHCKQESLKALGKHIISELISNLMAQIKVLEKISNASQQERDKLLKEIPLDGILNPTSGLLWALDFPRTLKELLSVIDESEEFDPERWISIEVRRIYIQSLSDLLSLFT